MDNEVYVLYQACLDQNHLKKYGIDIAALKAARDSYLNHMAYRIRHNEFRKAKQMAFEILLFDDFMTSKFLETTKEEDIPVSLSVMS